MADPIVIKVSELTELTELATGDLITVVDISEPIAANKTKKLKAGNIKIFSSGQLGAGVVKNTNIDADAVTYSKIDGLGTLQASDKVLFFDKSAGKFGYLTWPALHIDGTAVVDKAILTFLIAEELEPLEVGQKKLLWPVPPTLSGYTVVKAVANVMTASTSGIPTFDIRRGRRSSPTAGLTYGSMLSTKLTIDVGEYSSSYAAIPAVFNSYAALLTDDVLSFDITIAGTATKFLSISLELRK